MAYSMSDGKLPIRDDLGLREVLSNAYEHDDLINILLRRYAEA